MPVLSRAGCNMGSCHGGTNGKGTLKLSLRGEAPDLDFEALTRDRNGRKVNVDAPERSLLLRKPAELTDHEGGKRFEPGSREWTILHDWIAAGAPADPPDAPALTSLRVLPEEAVIEQPERSVALRVEAGFSDGSVRDVTAAAVFESSNFLPEVSPDGVVTARGTGETTLSVRYAHLQRPVTLAFLPEDPGFRWSPPPELNFIDRHVDRKLKRMKVQPAPVCDDVTFVRRAYLDLAGRIPTREEAGSFLSDPSPDRRDRLIDRLLGSPEFAMKQALYWADLLRVDERMLDDTGVAAFHGWIREWMALDRPVSGFVHAILTATGSTYRNPPANFYRAVRDPVQQAESVAQVFLGTRLACAKCHNHPFEKWTQDDYYGFAALFDGIRYEIVENRREDENDKLEFKGEQIIHADGKRGLKDPRTGGQPPRRLLGSTQPAEDHPLDSLADWLTAPDHPLFARVVANRIWAQLMGTGIVDPVDDFRLTNPPSNPDLLNALTAWFIQHGMRIKPLVRVICQSRTWQSATGGDTGSPEAVRNFAWVTPVRLPAETLLDSIHLALAVEPEFGAYPGVKRALELPGTGFNGRRRKRMNPADEFLRQFGKPPRATVCECERTGESSLSQVFLLTSGPALSLPLTDPDNRLAALSRPDVTPDEALDELFWRTLSRAPSRAERERLAPLLSDPGTRRPALEDLAWSLLNSKEFLLRR